MCRKETDVVTCPPDVILQLLKHPLTDIGLEKFLADYRKFRVNNIALFLFRFSFIELNCSGDILKSIFAECFV